MKSNMKLVLGLMITSVGVFLYSIRASNAWNLNVGVEVGILGAVLLFCGIWTALSSLEEEK